MTQRREDEQWSTLVFPKEKPPQRDFALWRLVLRQVVPLGGVADRLGRLTHAGYKIWDWRWDQEQRQLLHHRGDTMDIYKHSNLPRVRNTPNRWTRKRMNQLPEERGIVCSVREAGLAVVAITSSTEPPREKLLPTEIRRHSPGFAGIATSTYIPIL